MVFLQADKARLEADVRISSTQAQSAEDNLRSAEKAFKEALDAREDEFRRELRQAEDRYRSELENARKSAVRQKCLLLFIAPLPIVPFSACGAVFVGVCLRTNSEGCQHARPRGYAGRCSLGAHPMVCMFMYTWRIVRACAQEEISTLKSKLRQLGTQLEVEGEAHAKALKQNAAELAQRETGFRRELKAAEDKFRSELERTRLDAVRFLPAVVATALLC